MSEPLADWVGLSPRFTPGWPWPEKSWGLDPMFGDDGWCRACGTPKHAQTGSLVLQARKLPRASVWMPNWQFDVVCVSLELAPKVADGFEVEMRAVHTPRSDEPVAMQLVSRVTDADWFSPQDVEAGVTAREATQHQAHVGAECPTCRTWRWRPLKLGEAPVRSESLAGMETDVAASPEWFGSGWSSRRHLLFRRDLGVFLAEASPRLWRLVEVERATRP